ncbi:hypothetical protein [Shewanella halifaxensis]|uniref:hypothetical protein n=1 Tax=Shewanella halifaxensis TaxID=271098 RepID=UPI000D59D6D8|nr:hypothetical protein [Shewanella halifaxensis]
MEINKLKLIPKLIAATSIMLISFSATALERYAGLEDGSDENLKAVCKDYMVNSFLKNDPELFFHLLPKSMKKMEPMLEKDWPEGHLKRFGAEPLTKYDFFEMKNEFEYSEYKGLKTKSIKVRYKAGIMRNKKGTWCNFHRHEDGRWYFAQKP